MSTNSSTCTVQTPTTSTAQGSQRIVTVIEPITLQLEQELNLEPDKLRVAAYARVSTEQDEQESSYEAQVDYYTRFITNNPHWELIGIFADRGITGTNTKNREQFKKMVEMALAGKIDLILTKSISRFARNTVDALQTVRELKAKGVEVIFEKENIHTLDPKCEVLLTIMSSLAQEESRSISENVRWGKAESMRKGNVYMPYGRFLGYRKGTDGRPEIVEEEAEIVRDIYAMFLSGMTVRHIARELTKRKIPTPGGKEIWSTSTVESILSNEKYKGEAFLQKTYTADYLTKHKKRNCGEKSSYIVRHSHEPIIDPEIYDRVQDLIAKRRPFRSQLRDRHAFSSRIICGDCGGFYGHKVWHNKSGAYDVWYCNHRYNNTEKCLTPILREGEIETAFTAALKKTGIPDAKYSEALWREKVEKVTICQDRQAQFNFKDSTVIKVQI